MAPDVALAGEVEIDEVYVVAGHKGQPAAVAKRAARAPAQAGRCAGTRYGGEGQVSLPRIGGHLW
jgi:hypothetical protein